jgi:hypothetical protein
MGIACKAIFGHIGLPVEFLEVYRALQFVLDLLDILVKRLYQICAVFVLTFQKFVQFLRILGICPSVVRKFALSLVLAQNTLKPLLFFRPDHRKTVFFKTQNVVVGPMRVNVGVR